MKKRIKYKIITSICLVGIGLIGALLNNKDKK